MKPIKNKERNLIKTSYQVRKKVLEIIYNAKSGHTGGSLSSVDILVALFGQVMKYRPHEPGWPERDRFILSKGHSVESYYCILAEYGFFDPDILNSYGRFNSILAGHPTDKVPGVELNSGSLGHGLSVGTGMALAAKLDGYNYKTYVLMGDGEQGEGSVIEAAMSGAHYKLDNLIAIIDRNGLQISGPTEKVLKLEDLSEKWNAIGWHVHETDGHHIPEMVAYFNGIPHVKDKPHLLIAKTVKGKGVSFIENDYKWHHKVPDQHQYEQAIKEIEEKINVC